MHSRSNSSALNWIILNVFICPSNDKVGVDAADYDYDSENAGNECHVTIEWHRSAFYPVMAPAWRQIRFATATLACKDGLVPELSLYRSSIVEGVIGRR